MKPDRPTLALAGLSLVTLGALAVCFTRWTATSGGAFPVFLLVVAGLVYLPGRVVTSALRLALSPLEHLVVSVTLGLPMAMATYWLSALAGRERLVWALPATAALLTLQPRFRFRSDAWREWRPRYAHTALVGVFILTVLPDVTSPFYFQNLARTGDSLTTYLLADVVSHVSIATELTHAMPPQNPFFPDRPLVYHYGMHTLVAAFATFGLSVADLMTRFLPIFFMALTVLGVFVLARRWLDSEGWAAFAPLLVILGEDFSFLGGFHAGLSQTWASYFFGMPTVISLYMMNPMLSALGVFMVVLFCLERHLATNEDRWLVAVLLLAPVVATSKVFVAVHLLMGLGATAVVYAVRHRQRAPIVASATTGIVVVGCVLTMSSGYHGLDLALRPWPYVTDAILRLGLRWTWVGQQALAFQRGEYAPLSTLVFFGLALPGYLLLTLGARALGLRSWFRALVRPPRDGAFRFLVAALILSGAAFALLVSATAAGYPRRAFGNNACWFFVQSKYLMWLFALEPLRRLRGRRAVLVASALLLVSLPSAVHFHVLQAQSHPTPIEASMAEAVAFLADEAAPGSSCYAREGPAQILLVTTTCHALALDVFPSSYLTPAAFDAARKQREEFWRRWREDPGRLPAETLAAWHVDYVVAELASDGMPAIPPAGESFTLEPRFANAGYAVYRVRWQGAEPGRK